MKSYPTKFKSFLWKIVQMGILQKLQNSIQTRGGGVWRFFGFKIQTCEFTKIWIHLRSKCIEHLIEFIEIYLIFRNTEFIELLNS